MRLPTGSRDQSRSTLATTPSSFVRWLARKPESSDAGYDLLTRQGAVGPRVESRGRGLLPCPLLHGLRRWRRAATHAMPSPIRRVAGCHRPSGVSRDDVAHPACRGPPPSAKPMEEGAGGGRVREIPPIRTAINGDGSLDISQRQRERVRTSEASSLQRPRVLRGSTSPRGAFDHVFATRVVSDPPRRFDLTPSRAERATTGGPHPPRRSTTQRLFAGISTTSCSENPCAAARSVTTPRSRTPHRGSCALSHASKASLLGAVCRPSRV